MATTLTAERSNAYPVTDPGPLPEQRRMVDIAVKALLGWNTETVSAEALQSLLWRDHRHLYVRAVGTSPAQVRLSFTRLCSRLLVLVSSAPR